MPIQSLYATNSYMVFVVAVATTVTFGRLQTAPGIPIYKIGAKLFGVTHPQTHSNILDLVIWIPIAVHFTCDIDVCDFIYEFNRTIVYIVIAMYDYSDL